MWGSRIDKREYTAVWAERQGGDRMFLSGGGEMTTKKEKRQVRKKQVRNKRIAKQKARKIGSGAATIESLPCGEAMKGLLSIFGETDESEGSPVDEAQQIMYEAWEAPTRERAVALAKKALSVSAGCADAYNLLAEESATTLDEVIELYRKGVEAGERALGKETFEQDVGYFWGLLETRPYMRARAGLAQSLWAAGKREEAVGHYRELLRLNPNDNQGIRDSLMPCLIELGRDQDAEKLFKAYKDDGMAVWLYSRALLDFRKYGDSPVAGKSLAGAMKENRHVPAYLLGRKKMPKRLPAYHGFGDENEAIVYAESCAAAWKATPGALAWLAARTK